MELVTTHPSGGYILEELHPGMTAEKVIHVSDERIRLFAEASDDFNPVHLDDAFASKTAYRGRIAHGLLSASFGSAVVGTILPSTSPRPWASTCRSAPATMSWSASASSRSTRKAPGSS